MAPQVWTDYAAEQAIAAATLTDTAIVFRVGVTDSHQNTPYTLTPAAPPTAGNWVVLMLSSYTAATFTVVDSDGVTFALGAFAQDTGDIHVRAYIWYAQVKTGGAGYLLTITPTGDFYPTFEYVEVSKVYSVVPTLPLDAVSAAAAGGVSTGSVSCGTLTPLFAHDVLFAVSAQAFAGIHQSAPAGWALLDDFVGAGGTEPGAFAALLDAGPPGARDVRFGLAAPSAIWSGCALALIYQGVVPLLLYHDTFHGTDGTSLVDHTPDFLGNGATGPYRQAFGEFALEGGRAVGIVTPFFQNNPTSGIWVGEGDYTATFRFHYRSLDALHNDVSPTTGGMGVLFPAVRCKTDGPDAHLDQWSVNVVLSGTALWFYQLSNYTSVLAVSAPLALVDDTDVTLTINVSGSTLRAAVGGVLVLSHALGAASPVGAGYITLGLFRPGVAPTPDVGPPPVSAILEARVQRP